MKRIAIISDTHGLLASDVCDHIKNVDEVWHAGDIGNLSVLEQMEQLKPFKAVYGNIDGHELRYSCPLDLYFECEGVKVYMTHIGGYPGRYTSRVRHNLIEHRPDLYICGHSHICKVVKDNKLGVLHVNPGACGIKGFHQMRTMVLMECAEGSIKKLQVVELGLRTAMKK